MVRVGVGCCRRHVCASVVECQVIKWGSDRAKIVSTDEQLKSTKHTYEQEECYVRIHDDARGDIIACVMNSPSRRTQLSKRCSCRKA